MSICLIAVNLSFLAKAVNLQKLDEKKRGRIFDESTNSNDTFHHRCTQVQFNIAGDIWRDTGICTMFSWGDDNAIT